MDNVIRLSKFVKNLGISNNSSFFNNRTGNICYRKYGGCDMFYAFCIFRYCFNFGIQETNNCSK